jgi:hypothetical protein
VWRATTRHHRLHSEAAEGLGRDLLDGGERPFQKRRQRRDRSRPDRQTQGGRAAAVSSLASHLRSRSGLRSFDRHGRRASQLAEGKCTTGAGRKQQARVRDADGWHWRGCRTDRRKGREKGATAFTKSCRHREGQGCKQSQHTQSAASTLQRTVALEQRRHVQDEQADDELHCGLGADRARSTPHDDRRQQEGASVPHAGREHAASRQVLVDRGSHMGTIRNSGSVHHAVRDFGEQRPVTHDILCHHIERSGFFGHLFRVHNEAESGQKTEETFTITLSAVKQVVRC